ncbi:HAD domain-containing protein [Burkholderia ubonensis]|uniref:HAD domain-containing protein n=2 Tax=Burkholderia ubonensis TaxID=101571 RepID=UPI001E41C1E9|nr:HAD domain-containing protein [Burkholderia ubonensis]
MAEPIDVGVDILSRIEDGVGADTELLFRVLKELGLAVLVMPKTDASEALSALGHSVDWYKVMATHQPARKRPTTALLPLGYTTPTLFVDFDGTLHIGNAYIDDEQITLDTGRSLLEFAPLLAELLEPYPSVEIVLTTSWVQTLPVAGVIAHLPEALQRRVVGTTRDVKPRRSYVLDGTERTYVISSYAYGRGLKNWLAIDDAVFGAERFGREPGELADHFLLLDPTRGICDENALSRIRKWLTDVHTDRTR